MTSFKVDELIDFMTGRDTEKDRVKEGVRGEGSEGFQIGAEGY